MVALAAASPEVAFVVGVSAPGVSAIASVLWQIEQALRHGGVSDAAVPANTRAMTVLYRAARSLGLVERGQVSWDLDPAAAWARARQPVLLIYGEHDRLVPPAKSASVITQALAHVSNAGHTVVRFAGTDHGIFASEDGFRAPQDYERGSLRFGAGYLDTMVDWVRATVTGQPSPARCRSGGPARSSGCPMSTDVRGKSTLRCTLGWVPSLWRCSPARSSPLRPGAASGAGVPTPRPPVCAGPGGGPGWPARRASWCCWAPLR